MDGFALMSPENEGKSAEWTVSHLCRLKWRKKCEIGVITLLWADDSRTGSLRVQNGRFRTYVAGKWGKKCEIGVITLLWADDSRTGR
jgi:hypothetical protein